MKSVYNLDIPKWYKKLPTMTIPEIVSKYRGEKSLREFAAELSNGMPIPITHQTIKNWEDGLWKPSYYFILRISEQNIDWRRDFAFDILEVLKPEPYIPYQPNTNS